MSKEEKIRVMLESPDVEMNVLGLKILTSEYAYSGCEKILSGIERQGSKIRLASIFHSPNCVVAMFATYYSTISTGNMSTYYKNSYPNLNHYE